MMPTSSVFESPTVSHGAHGTGACLLQVHLENPRSAFKPIVDVLPARYHLR